MSEEKQSNWFRRHKVLSVLLGLFILGIIASASGGSKTDSNSQSAKEPKPPATVVDYKAFGDEFDANQVAAEGKWKGKQVQFTAPISNITDNGLSFQNASSKEFSLTQISCAITDKSQLNTLKNGQNATVKGTVIDQTLGVINLSDCEVVK